MRHAVSRGAGLHLEAHPGRAPGRGLRSNQRAAAGENRHPRDHADHHGGNGERIGFVEVQPAELSRRGLFPRRPVRFRLRRIEHGRIPRDRGEQQQCAPRRSRADFARGSFGERAAKRGVRRDRGRAGLRRFRVPDRSRAFHVVRALQGEIARRFWLQRNAGGDRRGGRDHPLFETAAAAEGGPSRGAALRRAGRLRDARCRHAGESRAGRIPRRAQHEPARRARPHGHADGRPEIAELDPAAVARSRGAGAAAAVDRRFVARGRSARGAARLPEIDPRSRARGGPVEPGLGERARPGGVENLAPANPGAEERTAEADRTRGFRKRTTADGDSLPRSLRVASRDAGTDGTIERGAGGRSTDGPERRRHFPRRLRRGPGRAAAGFAGREKLDRAVAGTRDRGERNQVAQGPVQFRLRLLHRDHEIEPGERAGALHPQTNDRRRRAFHHAGAEGNGIEDSRRGRKSAAARVSAFPNLARRNAARTGADPGDRRRNRDARRHLLTRGNRAALRLFPAGAERIVAARDPRRAPSGARSKPGRGEVRA